MTFVKLLACPGEPGKHFNEHCTGMVCEGHESLGGNPAAVSQGRRCLLGFGCNY